MSIDKDLYIRIKNNSSLIVSPDDEDDIALSVHVPGGHLMVNMHWHQALDLIEALRTILEEQWDA